MIHWSHILTEHEPHMPRSLDSWWSAGDGLEQWQNNMQDRKRRRYLERQGWHHEQAILYRYNSLGFRGDEFDGTLKTVIVLGCSFTFGTGLREDQAWPWILAAKLHASCANLAWGGGSADRCFRMAEYWIPRLRPCAVVMLTPPGGRMELVLNDHDRETSGLIPPLSFNDNFLKNWLTTEENIRLNQVKNQLAVGMICHALNTPCAIYETVEFAWVLGNTGDLARDFQHQGPMVHRAFADKVYQDLSHELNHEK